MKKCLNFIGAIGLASSAFLLPQSVYAVGAGLDFGVQELNVPGSFFHEFRPNSIDLTYHSCVRSNTTGVHVEKGYFWNSSYQKATRVVDSQINYFLNNGYRIYGIYKYQMTEFGTSQLTPTGKRLNFVVTPDTASIVLYLDVNSNTSLGLSSNCGINIAGAADDIRIGYSNTLAQGEKSETNGLANGDFDIVFAKWTFLTDPASPIVPLSVFKYRFLRFNGNVTRLQGSLGKSHRPEGSGNIYWQDTFIPFIPFKLNNPGN